MAIALNSPFPRQLLFRLPKVCVAITSRDAGEMFEKAEVAARDNEFLEFRLDHLSKPALAIPKIKRFTDLHPHVFCLATCRSANHGGEFRGSIASQIQILGKAADSGCQLIDVELETAERLKAPVLQKLRNRAALILSFHDFRATKKLDALLERMTRIAADFYKVVTTATTLADNVSMMKFLERHGDRHSLIALCMGEQGIISRVLGVRAGSVFTFGSANRGEETGPGQIKAQELRGTYRIESLDAATRVYGVAGDPIAHSLSPLIMNTALRRENVNGVYLALHAKSLPDLLSCIRDIPIHGLSITMPYKSAMVEHLDNSDAHTNKIGACNTVVRAQDGKLYGFNTDTSGVVRPLERRLSLPNAKVLVIGAGGAGRAAVYGLKERGCEVYIINRSIAKAQKLARSAHARLVKRSDLKKMTFDVIINATPVGMGPSKESPLHENELNARFLMEMIYDPPETKLVEMARARGIEIIPGIEMLVQQAARQFEIWTGKPAPFDEMLRVANMAAQERAAQKALGKAAGKRK